MKLPKPSFCRPVAYALSGFVLIGGMTFQMSADGPQREMTTAEAASSAPSVGGAPEKTEAPGKGEKGAKKAFFSKQNQMEGLLQAIRALPPEKRHQLKENVNAWQKLSEAQKEQLRERESVLKKRVAEELASCVSGARLSQEEMESLQRRYLEERRKMEVKLRAEMEQRRKTEIEHLTEKFREELRQRNSSGETN